MALLSIQNSAASKMSRVVLIVVILFFITFTAKEVTARSLEIIAVDIQATVLPNGDLKVIENRTIAFNGQFRGADQKIKFAGIELYSEILIREGESYYTLVEDFPTTDPGTYAIRVYGDQHFMVDWSFDALNEIRTFTLEYIARDAVVVHNDVAELYYVFIGDEWEFPTATVRVILFLPESVPDGDIRAWGHGPLHGDVQVDEPGIITWSISPLPAKTFLEGRVVFPRELVAQSTRFSNIEALPSILQEEKRWAMQSNLVRVFKTYQIHFSFLFFLAIALNLIRKYRLALNRGNAYRGKYYRELPGDYSPAVAGYLWNKKKIRPSFLTAHILDLARRRHLLIEEIVAGGEPGSKKGDSEFLLVKTRSNEGQSAHDRQVTDFIFGKVHHYFAKDENEANANKRKEVTLKEIHKYAEKKPRDFNSFYSTWLSAAVKLGEDEKFFEKKLFRGRGCLLHLALLALAIAAVAWLQLYLFACIIFVLTVINYFAMPTIYYTKYGADHLARWRAFRQFLLHFSRLEKSTVPSLAVWEHYLVYAVVLDIARKVIKQLHLVFPNIEQDPVFSQGSWAAINRTSGLGVVHALDGMTVSLDQAINRARQTSVVSISSSSSGSSGGFSSGSGSGGGFSSGGGGGFGGGGGSFR